MNNIETSKNNYNEPTVDEMRSMIRYAKYIDQSWKNLMTRNLDRSGWVVEYLKRIYAAVYDLDKSDPLMINQTKLKEIEIEKLWLELRNEWERRSKIN